MGMPSCRAALAEVNDAAVVVRGVSRLDDGLARPGNRPGPSFDPLGAFHRDVRYLFKRDHLHDDSLLKLTARKRLSKIRRIRILNHRWMERLARAASAAVRPER